MKTRGHYSVLFLAAASPALLVGCFEPDPRSVDGALTYAARAVEQRDTRRLFRILDQQGRHALDASFKLRHDAAKTIREQYPAAEKDAALRELGDALAATATDDLFAKRCDSSCIAWFDSIVGAPAEQQIVGDLVKVRTVRDTNLTLRLGTDGWYGIVWRTEQLSAERERAARDLAQVQDNARTYSARRALESQK